MEKLLLSILNMSLTASYVIIVICIVRFFMKKAPKWVSYALWGTAGFRLVVPFSFESVLSLLPFNAAPIPQNIVYQPVPHIDSGILSIDTAVSSILPAATPDASINPMQIYLFIGSVIWVIGIFVLLIYSIGSIILLKWRLRYAVFTEGNIYEAEDLKTPFVLGFFRPKIYIPSGLAPEEKSYILLHEQTHVRRFDHVIKLIAYFILCIHWFNPLVWIAFILMCVDMELSCDEYVLKELGADIKKVYSASLVSLAAGKPMINGSPLAFGEGGIKTRVKNILNFKKPARWAVILSAFLAAVLSIGFAFNRIDTSDNYSQFYDYEDLTVGMSQKEVHEAFGQPDGILHGSRGDVYILDDDTKITIYYNADGIVENIDSIIRETEPLFDAGYNMTLDDVRMLARKGEELLFEDFANFKGMDASSILNYHIMVYSVENDYRLVVRSNPTGKPDYVGLESVWSDGGTGIDIRSEDLEDFLNKFSLKIIMSAEEEMITSGTGQFTLMNTTEDEFIFGSDFKLKRRDGDSWMDVNPIIENYGFNDIGYILEGYQVTKIDIDWEWLYGRLPAGDYKISKNGLFTKASGKNESYVLTAEFSINTEKINMNPVEAKWSPEQNIGVDMVSLDYASDDIVIFHGYFGLFVYDLHELQIVRSLDLESLNCHYTQGDNYCEVLVSQDGDKVQLHPMSSDTMFVYTVSDNTLYETEYREMENQFRNLVAAEEVMKGYDLVRYSYNAVKFSYNPDIGVSEFGVLFAGDWTIEQLCYVRDDMMYGLFSR